MPATLPGNRLFYAGWESGTLLRGTAAGGFNGSSGSPTVVSEASGALPAGSGYTHGARFLIDNTKYDGFGDRSEVQGSTNEVEGQLRWYKWSFYLPTSFPALSTWQVFGQWHSSANGSPPLCFYSTDGINFNLTFNLATGSSEPRNIVQYDRRVWTKPFSQIKGQWCEIVMRIVWSATDSAASHRLWFNGVQQTFNGQYGNGQTEIFLRNTDPGRSHYYKQGYYRGHTSALNPVTIYYAGFEIRDGAGGGTVTFDDTPPDEPPPPDPSVPSPPDSNIMGLTTHSGAWNNMQADSIRSSNDTLSERAKVTGYRVLTRGPGTSSSTQPVKVMLYKVNDSNPLNDTLVAGSVSDEVSIANNAAPAWTFFQVADFNLDPGVYALAVHSGGTQYVQYGYASGGQLKWANDTYVGGASSTWAADSATVNGVDSTVGICAYAILTEPDIGGGTAGLQGAITASPTTPTGQDAYFQGNLVPASASAITNVANFGDEIVSFRVPILYAVDPVTNEQLFRVRWTGSQFVAYDS